MLSVYAVCGIVFSEDAGEFAQVNADQVQDLLGSFVLMKSLNSQFMDSHMGAIWKDFVRTGISPDRLRSQWPDSFDNEACLGQSTQMREDFIEGLITGTLASPSDDQISIAIGGYQRLFCFLLNNVRQYLQESNIQTEWRHLYEAVISDLEECLLFLQKYFPRKFDFMALAPKPLLDALLRRVQQVEDQAGPSLYTSDTDIDATVLELIFSELKIQAQSALSFEQLTYLTELVKKLPFEPVPGDQFTLLESRFVDYGVIKNFNAPSFIEYCFSRLKERVSILDSQDEKKLSLKEYSKYLFQLPVEGNSGLHSHRPTVRDYLHCWIEQEILISMPDYNKQLTTLSDPVPKINTSVSVPVLALFTRVFKEVGIITNTNLQELFRSISTLYTSQRTENISPGNFHGKYYTVEESTKRRVTDLLLEMVKLIRRIS